MKRIINSFLLIAIFYVACDKENNLSVAPNRISLEEDSLFISSLEQSFKIKVITETDYSVSTDCDWISVSKDYSEEKSEIELSIKENLDSLQSRNGIVTIKASTNDATAILYIHQAYKSVIRLLTQTKTVSSSQQDIVVMVNSNCDYEVIIPQKASDWISLSGTKAMSESNIALSLAQNDTYLRREASVIFKNQSDGVQDTLSIVQDEGFNSLRILLRDNPNTTMFYKALVATHLADTLVNYFDYYYPSPAYDSTYACLVETGRTAFDFSTGYQNYDNGQFQRAVWPSERLFKYTLFIVSDSILDNVYGITDIDEDGVTGKYTGQPGISLRSYAKTVYNDPAHLDDNDTLNTSPLYKLMAYHILPEWLERDLLNFTNKYIVDDYKNACPDSIDMEDFYETLQRSLLRISTPYDEQSRNKGKNIFINRKGTVTAGNLEAEGVRIWRQDESQDDNIALNGGFYYVDSLLLYDQHTKNALNTRIRVMCNTLSPDFINSGARGRMRQTLGDKPSTFAVYGFKKGFCRNVSFSEGTQLFVRYEDKEWDVMYHDDMVVLGDYDLSFRLPPVPVSGTYEIRIFGNAQSEASYRKTRSTAQFYFGASIEDGTISWSSCGAPVSMSTMITDEQIGAIMDKDIKGSTAEEKKWNIQANDKAIRNRGYMKAPAGFTTGGSRISYRLRNHDVCFRKIVCEQYMEEGRGYYLRAKKADFGNTIMPFFFIEIVPFSVYSGLNGPEDVY